LLRDHATGIVISEADRALQRIGDAGELLLRVVGE